VADAWKGDRRWQTEAVQVACVQSSWLMPSSIMPCGSMAALFPLRILNFNSVQGEWHHAKLAIRFNRLATIAAS
jgi:hypothetical protein